MTITLELHSTTVRDLIKSNVTEFGDNVVIQTTPFSTPINLPKCIISPTEAPKEIQGNDNFFHTRKFDIYIITRILNTQDSLVGEDLSLLRLCDSVESLLENNMLVINGEAKLKSAHIEVASCAIPNKVFADNIFTRGALLFYDSQTMPYRSPVVIT
jgi:hypothetical protein